MRRSFMFVVLALVAVAAFLLAPPASEPEAEEYAVYTAVIRELYVRDWVHQVVIEDFAEAPWCYNPNRDLSEETKSIIRAFDVVPIRADTVASFFARNKEPRHLANRFELNVPVVLLPQNDLDEFFREPWVGGGWDGFHKRYPRSQGILKFSRVGFSSTMNQALVYAWNQWHDLEGAGRYVYLEKNKGKWKIEAGFLNAVS